MRSKEEEKVRAQREREREKERERRQNNRKNPKLTLRDDEEVGLPAQINVAHAGEEEARDGILVEFFEFQALKKKVEEILRLSRVEELASSPSSDEGKQKSERASHLCTFPLCIRWQKPSKSSPRRR